MVNINSVMPRNLVPYCALLLALLIHPGMSGANGSYKPISPLQISIVPTQPGLAAEQIQPGDVVEFTVTAVSLIDAQAVRIDIALTGGAELVSGDTAWKGLMGRNESHSIVLSVRAPKDGKGIIRANVSVAPSGDGRFSAMAQYVMGPGTEAKAEQRHPVKKDSRGRTVIEYR